ncbi:MAG: ABC transporter ATP-binding protein [Tindallia sp. MSAO_Bac2]|nr:MAG: ABC transporter ATP-binding protein [Tindallia sp. MSAO_Bac2]
MKNLNSYFEEEKLEKTYDGELMKRLLSYARPHVIMLLAAIILLAFTAIAELAQPYLFKIAIDDHINYSEKSFVLDQSQAAHFDSLEPGDTAHILREDRQFYLGHVSEETKLSEEQIQVVRSEDSRSVLNIGFVLMGVFFVAFFVNFGQVYILNYASNKIVYAIRHDLFSHLQRMSVSFFDEQPVGRLVTRVTNDTETLYEMYTSVLVNLFKDLFLLIGIIVVMLSLNLQLALITFSMIPVILMASYFFRSKVREAYREVRTKLAKVNASLNENLSGMRTIHVFKREQQQYQHFQNLNNHLLKANERENFISSIFRPGVELISSLAMALIIYFGGGLVMDQMIEFGVLFAFINYIRQFFQPINNLTEKYNILQSAMASSERIFQLMDRSPSITDKPDAYSPQNIEGKIEFKNVWFAYKEKDWILKDVSFKVEPGQSIAFVGATGAGKTSVINVLSRFYDIQHGSILIDDVDIREYSQDSLRKHIGMVQQDVFLFSGSIAENISLNEKKLSLAQIEDTAREVNAHQFIDLLPNKYEHQVLERGNNFSTGQQQLISFARTLAFDPSILILDEATAHIDAETEELIQQAIPRLMNKRTTIAIAHRLSTIQHCDQILVLHHGKIVEQGIHQELLKRKGYYHKLYRLQYQTQKRA